MWSGRFYVLAIDYDRYAILKHCPFESDQRKSVPCKYFAYITKWTTSGILQISEKLLLGSWWLSIHPSAHIELLGFPLGRFWKKFIFQNF